MKIANWCVCRSVSTKFSLPCVDQNVSILTHIHSDQSVTLFGYWIFDYWKHRKLYDMRKMHCQILGNTCSSSGEYHESEQTHRHELGVFCWEQVFQPMRAGGGAILASDWSAPLRVSALHSRVEALCQTNRRLAEAQCYKTPNLQLCDKCLEIKFWPGGCLSGIKPLNKSLKWWNLGHGLFDLSTLDATPKLHFLSHFQLCGQQICFW